MNIEIKDCFKGHSPQVFSFSLFLKKGLIKRQKS
uniref:Uncharacterized protein n=1 Tax=Anguilla anguilla TaxID=7936 RepID=A0A0E9PWN6_ANGAN